MSIRILLKRSTARRRSELAGRAVQACGVVGGLTSGRVVTVQAEAAAREPAVFDAGLAVHLMTGEAGERFVASHDDVAYVLLHVTVAGMEPGGCRRREVHLEIAEEVVAGDKRVRVGEI